MQTGERRCRLDDLRRAPSAGSGQRASFRVADRLRDGVELRDTAEPAACWIESLADGWLFLITNAPGSGWLLSVGLDPEKLLSQSRLVRSRIDQVQPPSAQFPAAPRVMAPLGDRGWIACGTAAMAFDPICGDGTAHAVREAILASAVIRAAARGEDVDALMAHYDARLVSAFQRHLIHCRQYYVAGFGGNWWEAEAASAARGIEWCHRRVGGHPNFRYRLDGLELHTVG